MPLKDLGRIAKTVETYMWDEVEIKRPTGETVNTTTLVMTKTFTEVYSGKAMITAAGTPAQSVFAGQHTTLLMTEIGIPRDTDPILPNDEVIVVTSSNNPDMEGLTFIVVNEVDSTFFTHRRLICRIREDAE